MKTEYFDFKFNIGICPHQLLESAIDLIRTQYDTKTPVESHTSDGATTITIDGGRLKLGAWPKSDRIEFVLLTRGIYSLYRQKIEDRIKAALSTTQTQMENQL